MICQSADNLSSFRLKRPPKPEGGAADQHMSASAAGVLPNLGGDWAPGKGFTVSVWLTDHSAAGPGEELLEAVSQPTAGGLAAGFTLAVTPDGEASARRFLRL